MSATETPARRFAYSVPEAAAQLSVSKNHLWKLIERGVVRQVRLGGRVVVPASELDRVLEEGLREAADG